MDKHTSPLHLRVALLTTLLGALALVPMLFLLSIHEGAQAAQQDMKKVDVMKDVGMQPPPKGGQMQRVSSDGAVTVAWPHQTRRRKASAEQVAQWLKELGDNSYKVRVSASKALIEVGQPAMKGLEEALRTGDAEVRRRAESLIDKIEVNEALAPTTIDLKVTDTAVPAAVAAFNLQSRLKLELVPRQGPVRQHLEQKKIKLDLDGAPFWEALDRLCEAAGLFVVSLSQTSVQLQLAEGGAPYRPPAAYTGPFRMRITGMNYYRNLTMAEQSQAVPQQPMGMGMQPMPGMGMPMQKMAVPQQVMAAPLQLASPRLLRQKSLTASMDLLAEPHLGVLSMGSPAITAAENEDGQSLVPSGGTAMNYYSPAYYGNGGGVLQLRQAQFSLQPATKPAASLKVLRGTVPVEVLVQRKPLVTVDNVLATKAKVFKGEGDLTLAVLQVQDHGNGRSGNIRFFMTGVDRPTDNNAFNPNFNPVLAQSRFEISDAQGQRFNVNVNLNYNPNVNEKSLEGNLYFTPVFPNMGPAVRLTYLNHKALRTAVPFEFHSVPMP